MAASASRPATGSPIAASAPRTIARSVMPSNTTSRRTAQRPYRTAKTRSTAPRQKELYRIEYPLARSPLGGLARPAETVVAGPCFFQPSLEDAPDDPRLRDAEEHRLC